MKPWQNILLGCLLSLLTVGAIYLVSQPPRGAAITLSAPPTPLPIMVHINGAVLNPGVYPLPQQSRVQDAVQAAGGFDQAADTINVNLAARLNDGQKITIPTRPVPSAPVVSTPSPGSPSSAPSAAEKPAVSGLININTADKESLEKLPGIGSTRAEAIIAYRQQHGAFIKIEDIMNVPGIGQVTYNQIKLLISIQ